MVDKFLNISTKFLIVIIFIMTIVVTAKFYENKYMLVQGQEQTLEGSIYSSKGLEIAIRDINITEGTLLIEVKNNTDKQESMELKSLQFDNIPLQLDYKVEIEPYMTVEKTVEFSGPISITSAKEIDTIDIRFIVDDIYNIDLKVKVTSTEGNEEITN